MAKRALYDLTDEEFAYFVNEVNKGLEREGISHIFVGGTASQIQIAERLCKLHNTDLVTLARDERLQDYLRATDDIDLALATKAYAQGDTEYAHVINKLLDSLTKEVISPSEEHIFKYQLARRGVKRPIFQVVVDDKTDNEQRFALNVSRRPQDLRNLESSFYDAFIEDGQEVTLPYNPNLQLKLRVISPTNLFATKVSHFRPKDTMDIHNLADLMGECGETIDLNKVKTILGEKYSRNYSRFLSLIRMENQ